MIRRLVKPLRRYPITAFLLVQCFVIAITLALSALYDTDTPGFLRAGAALNAILLLAAALACSAERCILRARSRT